MKLERVKRFYKSVMGYSMGVASTIKCSLSKQSTKSDADKKSSKLSSVVRERIGIAISMGFGVFSFWGGIALFFGMPSYNYVIAALFAVAIGVFFFVGTEAIGDHYEDSF